MEILFALFLLITGLISIFAPEVAWYLSIGWKLRDAEPSDVVLIFHRITGGISIIVALFIFLSTY
jgi:hypothetical protein